MMQRNISSYLPIFYICLVVFSISIIHISEVVNKRRHQREIKAIDLAQKKERSKKKRKKPVAKVKKESIQKADTLTRTSEKPAVETKKATKVPKKIGDKEFFANLFANGESSGSLKAEAQSRTDIVIRYYKKEKDGDRVYQLRNLGFYIHERPPEDDFDDYASNAIFYGDSVKREDLIKIAYYLMENGLELQSMTLSKYHDAWKAHSVEIGTDTTALKDKPFTLRTLRKKWEDM